jgi:hypothetical protein
MFVIEGNNFPLSIRLTFGRAIQKVLVFVWAFAKRGQIVNEFLSKSTIRLHPIWAATRTQTSRNYSYRVAHLWPGINLFAYLIKPPDSIKSSTAVEMQKQNEWHKACHLGSRQVYVSAQHSDTLVAGWVDTGHNLGTPRAPIQHRHIATERA